MRKKFLKLIKFREAGRKTASSGKTRRKIIGFAEAPRSFAKIFTRTAHYLSKITAAEKKHGKIPQNRLHNYILAWAGEILGIIKVDVTLKGHEPDQSTPTLFVGNHVGYLDIPLLMASVPVVFVSKAEVAKWLVIGPASKSAGTVFVKRDSFNSRASTMKAIAACLVEHKQSLAIFPSGTTSIDEKAPWKSGAFKIAKRYNLPIQPFRLTYEPLRKVAFIDRDILPVHLWNLLMHGDRVRAVLEFGEVQQVTDAQADCERIRMWTQQAHK